MSSLAALTTMTWSPVSTWGAQIGLCFPRSRLATSVATLPSTWPSASITCQARLMSAGFGVNVRNGSSRRIAEASPPGRGVAQSASDAKGQSSPRAGRAAIGAARGRSTRRGYSVLSLRPMSGRAPEHRPRQVLALRQARSCSAPCACWLPLSSSGVAAACASFPPAEPGGPGLTSVDDWVSGRNKIWDLAFPANGLPPLYTENNSGVIFARIDGARARPPARRRHPVRRELRPHRRGRAHGHRARAPGSTAPATAAPSSATRRPATTASPASTSNYDAGAFVSLSNWTPDRHRHSPFRASTTGAASASNPGPARCS